MINKKEKIAIIFVIVIVLIILLLEFENKREKSILTQQPPDNEIPTSNNQNIETPATQSSPIKINPKISLTCGCIK